MKQGPERIAKQTQAGDAAPAAVHSSPLKYILRWLIVIFCLCAWALAIYFIW
jgi:hypothetical protein